MFHMSLTIHTTVKANQSERTRTFYAIVAWSNERNINARKGQEEEINL